MATKQELTIHGVKVLRPEPTKPNSLRCMLLNRHDYTSFEYPNGRAEARFRVKPMFCARCNQITKGVKAPPRPPTMSVDVSVSVSETKPAKDDSRTQLIKHATKLLQDEGYLVAHNLETAAEMLICRGYKVVRPSELAKGGQIKSDAVYIVGEDGSRTEATYVARQSEVKTPPKAPTPPEPRIIRETGKPPGAE